MLYIHPTFKDVTVEICHVFHIPGKNDVKIKVRWYNIHTHKHFGAPYEPILIDYRTQNLRMTKQKYAEFTPYTREKE